MYVCIGMYRDVYLVSCGVPQESVLGPRIFCYYTEGVVDIFDRHSPSYHFYADDMAAQFHGKLSDAPRIASAVAELITDVKEWCASMRLQLNTTKDRGDVVRYPVQSSKAAGRNADDRRRC